MSTRLQDLDLCAASPCRDVGRVGLLRSACMAWGSAGDANASAWVEETSLLETRDDKWQRHLCRAGNDELFVAFHTAGPGVANPTCSRVGD
ncbi:hypothetical protein E2C01_040196 [Portunus trituberculatus]|uniref:Uncharacterized protein n=1 Tax=Portunus trituberculatus TaxID=210409 RepID=A0A5B7FLW4_PORTR|nr:hypothetical protein [Portunus trituberculatus]